MLRRRGQLRRPVRRRGRPPGRRRVASRSTRARASSSSSTATRSSASCCRCPRQRTKGVLVFPTIDGKVVAGPTAHRPARQGGLVGAARGARRGPREGRRRCCPALDGAEPVASYAGLRPAGRGANYVIGPSRACPQLDQRRGDPLDRADARSLGIAEHVAALDRAGRRRARRRAAAAARRSVPAARGGRGGGGAHGPLILGIDEGTTGVKAALFDERLRPVREARRDKVEPPPAAGLGRAGRRGGPRRGRRGGRRAAGGRAAARSSPAASTTRASRCSPGTPRPARRSRPIVVWQDKRSQEVLDRLADDEARDHRRAAACRFDPYFSAAKLAWLLEHDEAVQRARDGGHAADGHGRLVPRATGSAPASPPTPRTASRTQLHAARRRPAGTRGCASSSACRATCCPRSRDTAGDLGTLRHESLAGRAAAARAGRRPAGRAGRRGLRRARPREGDLRHRRVRARPRRRRGARAGRRPAARPSPGASTAASSTRSTAACSRPARCSSGCAASSACADEPGRARRAGRARPTTAAARACCPALAGVGAPWWQPDARAVLAGLHGGTTRAQRRARRARGHRLARGRRRRGDARAASTSTRCAWTAALTNEPLLLAAAGRRDRRAGGGAAAPTRRSPGAAALAAVGAGVLASLAGGGRAAAGRPPRRAEPRRRSGAPPSTSAGARSCSAAAELR